MFGHLYVKHTANTYWVHDRPFDYCFPWSLTSYVFQLRVSISCVVFSYYYLHTYMWVVDTQHVHTLFLINYQHHEFIYLLLVL